MKNTRSNYQTCEEPEHESEFLNMVCIDEECNRRQLLCCYCKENHQTCKSIALKRFVKQFSDQINQMGQQEIQKYQHNDLILNFEKIEETMEYSHNLINDIFNKTKQALNDAKKVLNQQLNDDSQKKNQSVLLQKFEQEPSQINFKRLIDEIESFKPNSEKMSFVIKRYQPNQMSQQNIKNGKIYAQQYQSAANTFTEQFLNFHEVLRKNIQDFFINTPSRITEQDNNNSKPFDKFKSNNMFTSVQPINFNKQKEKQINRIDNDKEVNEINEKVKQNKIFKNIEKDQEREQLIDKNIQDSKVNEQIERKGILQQKENKSKQMTVIEVNEYKKFNLMPEQQEIIKLIFINKQFIGGLSKKNFKVFDISNFEQQTNIQSVNENEFTDVAYLELNEENDQLYLATKLGYISIYDKKGINKIKFDIIQGYKLDGEGIMKILVNPIDQYLFCVGSSKIVQILSLRTMEILKKKLGLQNYPTAFYSDQKNIFIGGTKFIQVWDYRSGNVQQWNNVEQKVTAFVAYQSKLFVSLEDKVQIYTQTLLNEFQLFHEVSFGNISTFQILNSSPFLIISYTEVSPSFITQNQIPKTSLYNYIEQIPQKVILQELFKCCVVGVYNGVEYCVLGLENGYCNIYKMELRYEPLQ